MVELALLDSPPELALLDYGMGNLHSVERALRQVGARVRLVTSPEELGQPDVLVLPGQGAFGTAVEHLADTGLRGVIEEWLAAQRPLLGICLGLQLLFESSEESAETGSGDAGAAGLGVFPGVVRRFPSGVPGAKVPHMGWNEVAWGESASESESASAERDWYYFVHSYFAPIPEGDAALRVARSRHGDVELCAAVWRGDLLAVQFHPEKSQGAGLGLLRRYLESLAP